MKSTFFVCVIFVLAACYSCSPVAKENKLIQDLANLMEPQQRTRRSVDLVSEIASVLEKVPDKIRNKRSNNELLDALAQFKEDAIDPRDDLAKLMASHLMDKFEEK